ncbi:hypothetical protein RRG08_044002 [Elysia crispata]|uniref:Uncharacterized protein n=1 Tax=Elysia crispata TaxID=231223 RepID=A0AAE1CR34_9GAST|nr:hypothetical protein RRG08_044002 [Elysia crispata]
MFYLHLLTRQPIRLGAVGCFMFYLHPLTRQPISLGAVGCFMFYLHLLTRQPIRLGAVGCFMFYLHPLTRQPISLGAVGCFSHVLPSFRDHASIDLFVQYICESSSHASLSCCLALVSPPANIWLCLAMPCCQRNSTLTRRCDQLLPATTPSDTPWTAW